MPKSIRALIYIVLSYTKSLINTLLLIVFNSLVVSLY
jgi:hypothetical protein